MSDYKSHGNAPIEFCGDQEGWIAVGSLSDDSPNSPCFPRVVLIGVGLGPSGKVHPSNIAAMLTIEQAIDLRERIDAAMGHPAPVDPAAEIARLRALGLEACDELTGAGKGLESRSDGAERRTWAKDAYATAERIRKELTR